MKKMLKWTIILTIIGSVIFISGSVIWATNTNLDKLSAEKQTEFRSGFVAVVEDKVVNPDRLCDRIMKELTVWDAICLHTGFITEDLRNKIRNVYIEYVPLN